MIKNITLGSDPEFFIFSTVPESSIGLIKGTKKKPEEVSEGYAILKDNVLIEGNIPPASSKEEFVRNMRQLKDFMSEVIKPYHLVSEDSAEFSKDKLNNEEARQFGCMPYFNAWTLEMNSPANLVELDHRTAGFHIHYGFEYEGDINKEWLSVYITRAFDYFVTYPSRLMHNDPIRSKYYGDYGNFRITPWGCEARSLGGYFTKDEYLGWVYDQSIKAIEYCNHSENIKKLETVTSPDTNVEENYNYLGINLKEQLYENIIDNKSDVLIVEKTI